MIEITFAFAIVVQAAWLVAQARIHRQEVRSLQRRLNSLGTELGILKARSHKPGKRAIMPEIDPIAHMTDPAALNMAAAEFRLPDFYRSERPVFESFSPSWI